VGQLDQFVSLELMLDVRIHFLIYFLDFIICSPNFFKQVLARRFSHHVWNLVLKNLRAFQFASGLCLLRSVQGSLRRCFSDACLVDQHGLFAPYRTVWPCKSAPLWFRDLKDKLLETKISFGQLLELPGVDRHKLVRN